jgi:hypothetical protein
MRGWLPDIGRDEEMVESQRQASGLTNAQVAERAAKGEANDAARRSSRPISEIIRAVPWTRTFFSLRPYNPATDLIALAIAGCAAAALTIYLSAARLRGR